MPQLAYTMHRGLVARPQQDALVVGDEIFQRERLPIRTSAVGTEDLLLAVADGVGTSPVPARASRFVLEALVKVVDHHPEWRQDGFVSAKHLRAVQQRLADRLGADRRTYGAATTLALVHVRGTDAVVLNAGDSRVYHVDGLGQWRRLSKDHTQLQALIDAGQARVDQAYASLYRALESALIADPEEEAFPIHRERIGLLPGARLVLCTDGVHEVLGETELWRLFDSGLDACAQLSVWHEAVLRRGAPDNFSLVLCECTALF